MWGSRSKCLVKRSLLGSWAPATALPPLLFRRPFPRDRPSCFPGRQSVDCGLAITRRHMMNAEDAADDDAINA